MPARELDNPAAANREKSAKRRVAAAKTKATAKPAPKPAKKRPGGAREGNKHNYRHGIFSKILDDEERKWLHEASKSMQTEIDLIRVQCWRAAKRLSEQQKDPESAMHVYERQIEQVGAGGQPGRTTKRQTTKATDYYVIFDRLMARLCHLVRTQHEMEMEGGAGSSEDFNPDDKFL